MKPLQASGDKPKGNDMLIKLYNGAKKYAPIVLLLLVAYGIIQAPYSMYKNSQKEINKVLEDNRPYLKVEASMVEGSIYVDLDNKTVKFVVKYQLQNVGNRPAYQTTFACLVSPLYNPDKSLSAVNELHVNPISSGGYSTITQESVVNFSQMGGEGIVLGYLKLKYSNQPQQGKWYPDEYWYAFSLDLAELRSKITFVQEDWINSFRPYVDRVFSEEKRKG